MRYYLVAGEKSGDLHGSNLIRALSRRDNGAVFRGFGGDRMHESGMSLTVHYRQMAFMGLFQVIMNLRKISQWMNTCRQDILGFKPDVVILIDYGGFNMRVAKFCRQNGIRVFYYISPKVWAWNTGRAKKLKRTVDRMFCILPFEQEFYRKFGWEVDYVGNPVLDAVKAFVPDSSFAASGIPTHQPVVALLPGSRTMELRRILPLMAGVVRRSPELTFVVAAIRELPAGLYAPLAGLSNVHFIYDRTYDLLSVARAAVVTSGTATLETGLFRIPQAVVYKATAIEYAIGSRVVKVDYISLVNLIAGRKVIAEFLQSAASVDAVSAELLRLIEAGDYRTAVLDGYEEVYRKLDTGSASDNTAALMVRYLGQDR